MYKSVVKRIVDVVVSLILLTVLFIPSLFIALLLTIHFKDSPFFTQKRPGKNGVIFKLIKFRTMSNKRDIHGNMLPDEDRLTGFGKVVRQLSLDEIPQLINVLKGEMSLIGPRPLLVEYLPLYNEFQMKRHDVLPGITGWAQVNGRNSLTWEDKFNLDLYYVENVSISLDCKIGFKTILNVIGRKGISSETSVTMEKFKGNE